MEGRGRMESGGKNEGPTTTKGERKKWIGGREGKGLDLPDEGQTASYAPVLFSILLFSSPNPTTI